MDGAVRAPVTKNAYMLDAACTSSTADRRLTLSLLNATSDESLETDERFIASIDVECDGQPHLIGYSGGILPRTIIQIAADDKGDITSLYAVLRPAS